ncbi:hypothetical protein BDY24DRAFT_441464 [Mrakia frigida]|uniref:uncharacterized protein n=1 Tax=Mrakia frigida TaxID=29902 RepID=UPI003FCC0A31
MSFPSSSLSSSLSSFLANDPRFALATKASALIQRAKREASLRPESITLLSREKLVEAMEKERHVAVEQEEKGKKRPTKEVKMFWEGEKTFSVAKMEDLKQIPISSLQTRQVCRGSFILLRTVVLPVSTSSASFDLAVVDPEGNAVRLSLFYFPILPFSLGPPRLDSLDVLFPVGTILAVKEPAPRMPFDGKVPYIRVDSHTDVVFVEGEAVGAVLNGVVWKEGDGDAVWTRFEEQNRQPLQAEKAFSKGIIHYPTHPDVHLLFLNRSHVYLVLERFNAALLDASRALHLLLSNASLPHDKLELLKEKAYYRRSTALYSLRRWSDAKHWFAETVRTFPNSKEPQKAMGGLRSSNARIQEESTGVYDLIPLYKQGIARPGSRMDVGDFVGPVEVVPSKGVGGGRGLVAARDVTAGTLLLATKAFAITRPEELPNKENLVWYDHLSERVATASEVHLRQGIVFRLFDQPELLPSIVDLHAGPNFLPPPLNYDLKPSLTPLKASPLHSPSSLPPIDLGRIEAVERVNSFSPNTLHSATFSNEDRLKSQRPGQTVRPIALFPATALINHSCYYNAFWSCIGDVQFVRAVCDIKKGEEILHSYAVDGTYGDRQEALRKHLGLGEKSCSCAQCSEDRKDGLENLTTRDRITSETFGRPSGISSRSSAPEIKSRIRELERVVKALEGTYRSSRGAFRPELFHAYLGIAFAHGTLAIVHQSSQPYEKVIEHHLLGLESLGVVVVGRTQSSSPLLPSPPSSSHSSTSTHPSSLSPSSSQYLSEANSTKPSPQSPSSSNLPILTAPRAHHHEAVLSALQIAVSNMCLHRLEPTRRWIRAAIWMEDVAIGGGKELFKERYGEMLATLMLGKFVD